jgi:esterase/lipase
MLFPYRIIPLLCLLLCQACSQLDIRSDAGRTPVSTHEFYFDDGGKALYFVLDKRSAKDRVSDSPSQPLTFMFVISGSDCASMRGILPQYFDGLEGVSGAIRILILHKRFITNSAVKHCSDEFMQADHPSRWIADQSEFIRHELSAARANGNAPKRIAIVGISEGAEVAPILAQRIQGITHLALLANGGMNPFDAYRLQAERLGFSDVLHDIERQCVGTSASDSITLAERRCRYWRELRDIRHTDNLLGLQLPIFIAMGEADAMVPTQSALLIQDKFAMQGKTTLQVHLFPNAGHDFRRGEESVLPYLWETFDHWLSN